MTDASNHACDLQEICSARHWSLHWLLIFCSLVFVAGRVLTLNSFADPEDPPFFSANDRSRWCTIRALGDYGTFEIDRVIENKDNRFSWDSIDKVQHRDADGQQHSYSSKPTLLPTLLTFVYKGVKQVTGKNLADDTTIVVRVILLFANVLPWFLYLWFLAKILELIPVRDWARYYTLACAGFGTYLSTFSITLNNHLPAAVSVMACSYALVRIMLGNNSLKYYYLAGLAGAFAAANELPALSFFAFAGLFCLIKSPLKTLVHFVLGSGIVAGLFFATNYIAHDDWRPPYAHRGDGPAFVTLSGDFEDQLSAGEAPDEIRAAADVYYNVSSLKISEAQWPGWGGSATQRWIAEDKDGKRFTIVAKDGTDEIQLCEWDNWYDYPGSYWLASNEKKSSVDLGQPSRGIYAFHVLFGHHGIFSLTPLWILSLAGMFVLVVKPQYQLRWFGLMTIAVSFVVVAFYIMRPEHDRNYGGWTSALRWLFWLAPMWLVSLLPIAEWLGKTKSGRMFCYLLLLVSGLSAMYSLQNPWVQPWLYEIWDWTGLPK